MLLVLGIHAVRRAQLTLMESTPRLSVMFFCDISERWVGSMQGYVCVFFGGQRLPGTFLLGN